MQYIKDNTGMYSKKNKTSKLFGKLKLAAKL